ncbi:107aa long hypothetical protein [Pyrococcus horikoshii OT3]|uniref:Uncharacterized protein n=1 Tax=Pyrococcus horikoshii (strain ATCC 700860 / DSM 12428 / JCM 9974 / NBRC 100139 / OT-3) TaxID=70601 RepID=O59356_PYRHO|nr:107aa long hypothetical protein [Pyrococcus horikoshii OT3]
MSSLVSILLMLSNLAETINLPELGISIVSSPSLNFNPFLNSNILFIFKGSPSLYASCIGLNCNSPFSTTGYKTPFLKSSASLFGRNGVYAITFLILSPARVFAIIPA